jgi:hypothetical protein
LQSIKSGFRVLRKMHSVQEFCLVFCMDVSDDILQCALREPEVMAQREEARSVFDYLYSRPIIIFEKCMLSIPSAGSVSSSWLETLVRSAL